MEGQSTEEFMNEIEKKVLELAETLKKCQDEKKIIVDERKAAQDAR
jgi:hypothetical protein